MDERDVSDQVSSRLSGPDDSLRGLINALHHLIIKISSRLRLTQIDGSAMGDAKGDYDIGKKLRNHIERISADSLPDTKTRTTKTAPAADFSLKGYRAATAQEPNELARDSKRKTTSQLLPRMNVQLQSNTMEHINTSLILAREGNIEGARLHIELAENGMRAASQFMSHEEYRDFELKVERRLDSIIGRDRPTNAKK